MGEMSGDDTGELVEESESLSKKVIWSSECAGLVCMVGLSSVANSLLGASMMRVSGDCTDEAEVLRINVG